MELLAQLHDTLRYQLYRWRHPDWLDYVDLGFGIAARRRRCKAWWGQHLTLCREFQESAFSSVSGSLTILGAGRLFDVDLAGLLKCFERIVLVDADPSVLPHWRRAVKAANSDSRVDFIVTEVTGSIGQWTSSLRQKISSLRQHRELDRQIFEMAAFLDLLESGDQYCCETDNVISLNLLSQIPIYWRDRVRRLLKSGLAIDVDSQGYYPEPLQEALISSMKKLQEAHLEQLYRSGVNRIVLISDAAFLYYTSTESHFQEEAALWTEFDELPGYQLIDRRSWFWHIAPQGTEHSEYGTIHDVQALCFVRH